MNLRKRKQILFLILLILIAVVIAATYAYFQVSTSKSSPLATASTGTECINVSYSEANTIKLDYNYPVSDKYALSNITPITVTVTNNCTANTAALPYALAITSLSNDTNYIADKRIRMHVKRKIGSAAETTIFTNNYLSNARKLMSPNTYSYLMNDLNTKTTTKSYANKTPYIIGSNTIANNTTHTYKIYLWVDYYEGDEEVYNGATHNESYNNITEGQEFAASINLVVNSSADVTAYEEIQYLESTGTQYIDTGLTVSKTNTYDYILDGIFTNTAWGGANGWMQFQSSLALNERNTIKVSYNGTSYTETIYVNGVLNETKSWDSYGSNNVKIGIFKLGAVNNTWWTGDPQIGKIYSLKIYSSGSIVRDFVPVYRKSDSVLGLYDRVNGVFYTNAGTGTFQKATKDNYQEVEYIEGTGVQSIDTGLIMNKTDSYVYVVDAMYTNSNYGGANGYMQFTGSLALNTRKTIRINYNGTTHVENIYVNDVLQKTDDWTDRYSGVDIKIGIFRMGNINNTWFGSSGSGQAGKIYSVKIYKDGELIRRFIPAYRKSDNVIGMYDTVNDVFYTNAGTGTFTKGNDIN